MTSGKLVILLGIRPDVIRASILIRELKAKLGDDLVFIWSGQHYSENMKDVFFQQLEVPSPDITFDLNTKSDSTTISSLILKLDEYLQTETVEAVVFLGDTNTVTASIACAARNIPIVHIEGCMRSYDWRMPEEKFRTVIDHLADVIYAYVDEYRAQGIAEGISDRRIVVTGNPIVDVLNEYFLSGKIRMNHLDSFKLLEELSLESGKFWVMTCHRRENVESISALKNILRLVKSIGDKVIFPAGYRTQKMLKEFSIQIPENLIMIDPIGYVELLELFDQSLGVLTDSGTIVEEACILGIPSLQMRRSTERPQVYDSGGSVKFDPSEEFTESEVLDIIASLKARKRNSWSHNFGDGLASMRIANDLMARHATGNWGGHQPDLNNPQVARNFGYGINQEGKP